MILRYDVPDDFGNHATLIVHAESRLAADDIVVQKLSEQRKWTFWIGNAHVTDVSTDEIIYMDYFNHEDVG